MALPQDFRDFIDLYGDGAINQELHLIYPARSGPAPSFSPLLDNAEELNEYGVLEACAGLPYSGYPRRGGLLQWGGTHNGDMIYWLTEADDPNEWQVVVIFRHLGSPSWRLFEGGMADFLIGVVSGTSELFSTLIGDPPGGARWTRYRDWDHDYWQPPTASFRLGAAAEDEPTFVDMADGAPLPLRFSEGGGGDQARYGRSGEQRALIESDPASPDTAIRLAGGELAPGIAYRIHTYIDIAVLDGSPHAVALELLRDGSPVPIHSRPAGPEWIDDSRRTVRAVAEIRVPAGGSAVSVQLRAARDRPGPDIRVTGLYLSVQGTVMTVGEEITPAAE
ncbi:SMI1/KNR4 family protein [Nocardia sp. NPDC052254]|uniref:SMI1/KNR4 family protein n=1 Tax=Nocardia sp. NPDC052254 TaxID=3155681 RepID=UPI00341A9101